MVVFAVNVVLVIFVVNVPSAFMYCVPPAAVLKYPRNVYPVLAGTVIPVDGNAVVAPAFV